MDKVLINVGCGPRGLPGFINIDHKTGGEAYPLAFSIGEARDAGFPTPDNLTDDMQKDVPPGSADLIRASHVLEHFSHRQTMDVLRNWVAALKPGGVLMLAVPDFEKIAKGYLDGVDDNWVGYAMGGHDDEDDKHGILLDEESLRLMMEHVGLADIQPWTSDVKDCASLPVSLNLRGTKPMVSMPPPVSSGRKPPKISAVMSMPRLAFTDNMVAAMEMSVNLGISLETTTGVNWGQCLERGIEPHLNDGTEWILALDYDTAFTPEHVKDLVELVVNNPEIDAIAPIQVKREENNLLFRPVDPITGETLERATLEMFEPKITPIEWAHFGLTLIKVEALKKLPKPWFFEKPAPDGSWNEGRIDNDIMFWKQFKACGFKAFLANHVSVGHIQMLVTWPDQQMKPFHQYVSDWRKKRQPEGVRK